MENWQKTDFVQAAVLLAIGVAGFCILLALIEFILCGGPWWAIPVPFAVAVYGIVSFYKKYYPTKR